VIEIYPKLKKGYFDRYILTMIVLAKDSEVRIVLTTFGTIAVD